MILLRNISPLGDVWLPLTGQHIGRDEVFEVTEDEASFLTPQTTNYEVVETAAAWTARPAPCPGSWPTPAWWSATPDGWVLLVLRCGDCGKVAGRFIVPVSRDQRSLPVWSPGEAIARGSWVSVHRPPNRPSSRRHRTQRNTVPNPCLHTWNSYPDPASDPALRRALFSALRSSTTPPAARTWLDRPEAWQPWARGDGATRLIVRPSV